MQMHCGTQPERALCLLCARTLTAPHASARRGVRNFAKTFLKKLCTHDAMLAKCRNQKCCPLLWPTRCASRRTLAATGVIKA
jgi:hypothetical protein